MDDPLEPDSIDLPDVRPNRRLGEQFPPYIYDQARMMSLSGSSSRLIERQLKAQYPGERTPTRDMVCKWRSQDYSTEELEAANQAHLEIVRRTQSLILDDLDENPTRYSAPQLAMVGGISMDKLIKQQQIQQEIVHPSERRLVFVFNGTPQIIQPTDD